jgi:hypothetical protein
VDIKPPFVHSEDWNLIVLVVFCFYRTVMVSANAAIQCPIPETTKPAPGFPERALF